MFIPIFGVKILCGIEKESVIQSGYPTMKYMETVRLHFFHMSLPERCISLSVKSETRCVLSDCTNIGIKEPLRRKNYFATYRDEA